MKSVLQGVRVVDLTQFQQGPYSTLILADMGAEVIKVEQRKLGDPGRRFRPVFPKGTSAYFEAHNRGKKSITVDARTPKGKEILYRLVEKSDMFAQNVRPGVAERLGLGYEALSRINPKIIYLTASAYGLKGPMGKKPGYDGVGQAMSGLLNMVWSPEGIPPMSLGCSVSDQTGAILLALGAVLALYHQRQTGQGQEVDVSLLGSTIALTGWTFQSHLTPGGLEKTFMIPRARMAQVRETEAAITSSHITKDRKPILLLLNGRELTVNSFKALGFAEFIDDPRFADWDHIVANKEILLAAMDERVRTKDRDEWLRLFDEAEAIAAPIHTPLEAAAHPQVIANEYVAEIDHPKEGRIRVMGMPIKMHKTPAKLGTAPDLSQHTDSVLEEIAGYRPEEIAQMRKDEII
jgi:crotonobetainyl-CoA:carnitine CoA-transferase CaiB-like acyl-CoA transferase